jgi:uncharacterized protein (DUF1684 family)
MTLSLLDWRRRVAALYAAARAAADPEAGWRTWRDGRDELFAGHPDSPLGEEARDRFPGLPFAPYDPALRFEAVLEPAERRRLELPTETDGAVPLDRIGCVRLGPLGPVDVWWLGGYGGGLFLPLRDGSAGRTTYGGGRYLLDTIKGADLGGTGDRLVVDVNFAYHPSCTYDPRWSCPLAPEGNRTAVPAAAGEQLPSGGWY